MSTLYSIKMASQRSGLNVHVIRAWERRYGALTPVRTDTNRRVYSDEDIERLTLLRHVVQAGHGIGNVARLTLDELERLAVADRVMAPVPTPNSPATSADYLEGCLDAVRALQPQDLERHLERAHAAVGTFRLIEEVIAPLMETIGEGWHLGDIRIGQEHMATAVMRTMLGHLLTAVRLPASAPCMIVTTPTGQAHEIGALVVASWAAHDGWYVRYLGSSVPAQEIAAAAAQCGAAAVVLSIAVPSDDTDLRDEIALLRSLLDQRAALIVGGRAAPAYEQALTEVGAIVCRNMRDFRMELHAIRQR